jgi:hypothetical protein
VVPEKLDETQQTIFDKLVPEEAIEIDFINARSNHQ